MSTFPRRLRVKTPNWKELHTELKKTTKPIRLKLRRPSPPTPLSTIGRLQLRASNWMDCVFTEQSFLMYSFEMLELGVDHHNAKTVSENAIRLQSTCRSAMEAVEEAKDKMADNDEGVSPMTDGRYLRMTGSIQKAWKMAETAKIELTTDEDIINERYTELEEAAADADADTNDAREAVEEAERALAVGLVLLRRPDAAHLVEIEKLVDNWNEKKKILKVFEEIQAEADRLCNNYRRRHREVLDITY